MGELTRGLSKKVRNLEKLSRKDKIFWLHTILKHFMANYILKTKMKAIDKEYWQLVKG